MTNTIAHLTLQTARKKKKSFMKLTPGGSSNGDWPATLIGGYLTIPKGDPGNPI
jgi:hypothetical protein